MMIKIKYAVFFIFGVVYGWALTYTLTHSVEADANSMITLAIIIAFFGGFGIIFSIACFLITNWKED